MDCSCLMRVTLFVVLLLVIPTTEPVNGQFVLTVNFINYTNPTGLCAECETKLASVTSADQLAPVCCDESPFTSVNCNNIGEARCDTRFRWTIRPFGASLETRPNSSYYFTDCDLPNATCPFSEMSTTFSQDPTGFLGVAANPLPVVPKTNMPWTGRVQFFIEAVDSGLPNIIDSLLINQDNLQLGANFTEKMTFTGYHSISQMTMSFRVTCQTGFCGGDCTTTSLNNPRIQSCLTNGEIVCTDSRYDSTADCNECLYNLDMSTSCSTCLEPNHDLSTNCSTCLFGFDMSRDCLVCLPGRNISTNCTTCLSGYTGENCVATTSPTISVALVGGIVGCVVVLLINVTLVITLLIICFYIPTKKSSSKYAKTTTDKEAVETIQTEQNPVYDVTTAVPPQPSTDDTDAVQLQPNVLNRVSTESDRCDKTTYYENEGLDLESETNDKEAVEAIQPEQNPVYDVTTAVPPQPSTDDTDAVQLQPNVLYGVSTESDRCDQTTFYENEGLNLGSETNDKEPVEAIQPEQNPVYDVTTAVPPQPSTDDTDAVQLQPNVLYGVSTESDRCDQTTYYENEGLNLGSETNVPTVVKKPIDIDKEPVETVQMEQNLAYHITTAVPAQSSTDDTDTIKLQPNVLYRVSTEPDRGDQTNYYENEGLGPKTKKQHVEEYDYVTVHQ